MSLRSGATFGLRAFRHRNYRLFFGGQAISLVGTWMQQVAQAWLVLELTGDPIWLGVITAAQFSPMLVFGLFAGLLADSLPKRLTLIATQVAMMVLALLLAALVITGVVQVWMIVVIAALLGVANAVDIPVRQAFGMDLVGREDVANAVALNSAMFNGTRIIGPAVAGLVIAAAGIELAFIVNGLSFIAVIIGLWLMQDEELHGSGARIARPTSSAEVFASLREGISYVRSTPIVLLATVTVGVVATVAMNFQVLIPAYASSTLGVDADGFGFLMASSGVGSFLAAMLLAFGGRARPLAICLGAVILGVSEIVLGLSTAYTLALVGMFATGFGAILMITSANTTIQLTVPDELRGRVLGVYTTVFVGSTPFGGLIIGWIASTAGPSSAMLVAGTCGLLFGLFALAWLRAIRRSGAVGGGQPRPEAVGGGSMAPARRR